MIMIAVEGKPVNFRSQTEWDAVIDAHLSELEVGEFYPYGTAQLWVDDDDPTWLLDYCEAEDISQVRQCVADNIVMVWDDDDAVELLVDGPSQEVDLDWLRAVVEAHGYYGPVYYGPNMNARDIWDQDDQDRRAEIR